MYYITFAGCQAPWPTFRTLTEARKYLSECKASDREDCRRRFGVAPVRGNKDYYSIEVGVNLWSSAAIHKA